MAFTSTTTSIAGASHGESIHPPGGTTRNEAAVRPILRVVLRALELAGPLIPSKRSPLVRTGEIERVDGALPAHQNDFLLVVDLDAVSSRDGVRGISRQHPPGACRYRRHGDGQAAGHAESGQCGERGEAHALKESATIDGEIASVTVGRRIAIVVLRHRCVVRMN